MKFSRSYRCGRRLVSGLSFFLQKQPALLLLCLILLSACRGDPQGKEQTGARTAPEEVLWQYQAYVDNNQFEKARAISTPRESDRLAMLAAILAEEEPDSSILHTKFLETKCSEKGDTAFCFCVMEDEYERYEQEFRLLWSGGRWLVDAPDEEIIIEDEVIEEMLESLDTLLR